VIVFVARKHWKTCLQLDLEYRRYVLQLYDFMKGLAVDLDFICSEVNLLQFLIEMTRSLFSDAEVNAVEGENLRLFLSTWPFDTFDDIG
jgi:hypothetical protein